MENITVKRELSLKARFLLVASITLACVSALCQEHQLTVTEIEDVQIDPKDLIAQDMEFWQNARDENRVIPEGFNPWEYAIKVPNNDSPALATHPLMISVFLPFWWERFVEIPLVIIDEELRSSGSSSVDRTENVVSIFNIKVATENNQLTLPSRTVLVADLSSPVKTLRFSIPMILRDGQSYFIDDPQGLARELTERISELTHYDRWAAKPKFTMQKLSGIPINVNTARKMHPFGIEVAILFRFGNTSVLSEFQWGGRHEKIPLTYPNVPFLAAN